MPLAPRKGSRSVQFRSPALMTSSFRMFLSWSSCAISMSVRPDWDAESNPTRPKGPSNSTWVTAEKRTVRFHTSPEAASVALTASTSERPSA